MVGHPYTWQPIKVDCFKKKHLCSLHELISHLNLLLCSGHEAVVDLLVKNGANIEALDRDFRTPLHAATVSGQKNLTLILLGKGANIEAKDHDFDTALHSSAGEGKTSPHKFISWDEIDIDANYFNPFK